MPMVALDAPRKKVVPKGSLEARWMVDEGDASEFIREAKKQPKMQAMMEAEAEARLESEKKAREDAALHEQARQARLKQIGMA